EIRGQILPASSTPANHPPTATITAPAGDVTIQSGQSVSFAGTATDPDGDAVTVLWSFGDGTTSALLNPGGHTYPMPGTYTVRLTATDAKGLADPNPPTRTITVQGAPVNLPPKGTITSPPGNVTIVAGQSVPFAGTVSDPNGDAVTVLWSFGDGGTSTLLSPGNHVYTTPGTYTARLTATDAQGLADPNPPTRTITVQTVPVNQPPSATITAPMGNVSITAGQSVTFAGTASDPDGDTVTVLWAFGDGATSTLLSPGAHTYLAAGTYTVTLTATDAKGLADPAPPTRTITVTPGGMAPTLTQLQTTIFTPLCTGCHGVGGDAGMNLSAGSAYSSLVNVPATTRSGLRVVPGNPGASALVAQLAAGHRSVSAANQALISAWISAGALNN
ncbi:MAG TPA: PKD domain-containing protein, partial [Geothrix sp.]|nr:PKD domain-containing protein [Geothrix sp.]